MPRLRGEAERTYKATAVGPTFPGTFENYVASVIRHWQVTKDDRFKESGKALEMLGLTWTVEAKQLDDVHIELRVGRLPERKRGGARDLVSLADVGFGVSQVLPVIVALLIADRGQLVYVEQPELHLHPKAQVALAKLLADAAKRGVRVVVETHSSLLLLGVQTLVAEGTLPPDHVALHCLSAARTVQLRSSHASWTSLALTAIGPKTLPMSPSIPTVTISKQLVSEGGANRWLLTNLDVS